MFRIIIKTSSVLLVFFLSLSNDAFAQASRKQLAGFNYKEVVQNADPATQNLQLVIAMHWMRSTPEEFEKYVSGFKYPVRILLVEGLYPYKEGFSFYPTEPVNYYKMSQDEKMKVFVNEGEKLAKFVQAAVKLYAPSKKPIVIGASQGGDLSYYLALKHSKIIGMAMPLLATIDHRIIPKKKAKYSASIFTFHGKEDPIVPISEAVRHHTEIKKKGFAAEFYTYPGVKHDISEEMQMDYMRIIESLL